jgi:hypothetical protein
MRSQRREFAHASLPPFSQPTAVRVDCDLSAHSRQNQGKRFVCIRLADFAMFAAIRRPGRKCHGLPGSRSRLGRLFIRGRPRARGCGHTTVPPQGLPTTNYWLLVNLRLSVSRNRPIALLVEAIQFGMERVLLLRCSRNACRYRPDAPRHELGGPIIEVLCIASSECCFLCSNIFGLTQVAAGPRRLNFLVTLRDVCGLITAGAALDDGTAL